MYVNLVRRVPLATTCLIAINIIILGLGLVSGTHLKVIRDYGFVPYSLFHINDNILNIIAKLFSSIFIHSGIAHLASSIYRSLLRTIRWNYKVSFVWCYRSVVS